MHFGANQSLESDERKSAFRIDLLLQVRGVLRQHEFARRTHVSLYKMTAVRCSVPSTDDHVCVDLWLTILQGDITDQRE